VDKDAFHVETVFELLNIIKDLHTGAGVDKATPTIIDNDFDLLCAMFLGLTGWQSISEEPL